MVPKYSANMLESASRWLEGKSNTVWAKTFGHSQQMISYALGLRDVADSLRMIFGSCRRCKGLLGAPLKREVEPLDCGCTKGEVQ